MTMVSISRGVTRPGAEVEDAAADRDSGSLPAIQGDRTPNPMLQPEPGNLLIMGPEDVIAFRGHAQTIPLARIFPRRIFARCGNGGSRQNSRYQAKPDQGGSFGGSPPLGCTGVTTVSPLSLR